MGPPPQHHFRSRPSQQHKWYLEPCKVRAGPQRLPMPITRRIFLRAGVSQLHTGRGIPQESREPGPLQEKRRHHLVWRPVSFLEKLSPNLGGEAGEAGRRQGDSALGPEIVCAGTVSETQAYAKSHSMFLPACCPRFPMLPICFRCSWGRRGGRGLLSFGE